MNLEEQRQFILSGNMYNDLTPELVKARENTACLTNEYNASQWVSAGTVLIDTPSAEEDADHTHIGYPEAIHR